MQVETVSLLLLDGRLIPGMLLHHAVLAPRASKPTRAFRFGTVQQLQARCGAGAFQNMLDHAASSSRRGPVGDDSTGPWRWCLTQELASVSLQGASPPRRYMLDGNAPRQRPTQRCWPMRCQARSAAVRASVRSAWLPPMIGNEV